MHERQARPAGFDDWITMLHWIFGLIVAGLAWMAWELFGELAGEVFAIALTPITRPVWRVIVAATWPWPSLLLVLVGAGAAWLGWSQHDAATETWRGGIGLVAFLGGCILMLLAPLIWVEAQRQRDDIT